MINSVSLQPLQHQQSSYAVCNTCYPRHITLLSNWKSIYSMVSLFVSLWPSQTNADSLASFNSQAFAQLHCTIWAAPQRGGASWCPRLTDFLGPYPQSCSFALVVTMHHKPLLWWTLAAKTLVIDYYIDHALVNYVSLYMLFDNIDLPPTHVLVCSLHSWTEFILLLYSRRYWAGGGERCSELL